MTKKTDVSKRKKFINFLLLAIHLFGVANRLTSLVKIEAYLAKKNIILLCVLSLFFGVVLFSTWICLLALLFSYLIAFHFSVPASLCLLLILNLLLILFIFIAISRVKRKISFIESREKFLSFFSFLSND